MGRGLRRMRRQYRGLESVEPPIRRSGARRCRHGVWMQFHREPLMNTSASFTLVLVNSM